MDVFYAQELRLHRHHLSRSHYNYSPAVVQRYFYLCNRHTPLLRSSTFRHQLSFCLQQAFVHPIFQPVLLPICHHHEPIFSSSIEQSLKNDESFDFIIDNITTNLYNVKVIHLPFVKFPHSTACAAQTLFDASCVTMLFLHRVFHRLIQHFFLPAGNASLSHYLSAQLLFFRSIPDRWYKSYHNHYKCSSFLHIQSRHFSMLLPGYV